MLDLFERVREVAPIDVTYDFMDTGMEYRATKRHLDSLEERYGVEIRRTRPERNIPYCVKTFGSPVISKMVSEQIGRLQSRGFQWEDEPLWKLKTKYHGIDSALKWWVGQYAGGGGSISSYSVYRNKWLKEYLLENPPDFKVSMKCCTNAKKTPSHKAAMEIGADLYVTGVRRSEGGVRGLYKTCFDKRDGMDLYRPVFFLTNADKAHYEKAFGIVHSDCYEKWGFERTGCVGCPFNRKVMDELDVIGRHEPNMRKACERLFARSYEWTAEYREFARRMESGGQPDLPI